jgi:hypothetical protein
VRRGGYLFVTWSGDHHPPHVHVYTDGRLVLKWSLELRDVMSGRASRRLVRLIDELRAEGKL